MVHAVADERIDVPATAGTRELHPEDVLKDLGGCGRYQIRMSLVVHLIKTIVCFSSYSLVIFSATPLWNCSMVYYDNTTCSEANIDCMKEKETCHFNDTACSFDPTFNSFVSEFNLVCDLDFIPNTINSINIAGILIGNLVGGQMADMFGRKRTFFVSLFVLLVFHLVAFASTVWQLLATAFFFTGIGCGIFITVQFTMLSEYSLSRWRGWMVGFPSWSLQSSAFALIARLIHDWRYVQLLIALMILPALLAWFVLPESFRWHVSHNRVNQAVGIIETIARFNKRDNVQRFSEKVKSMSIKGEKQKYTFFHLFITNHLKEMTALLVILWASLDVVSYGLSFGLQSLSGNIYLNLFFFSVAGIPTRAIAIWLQNRFGRRVAIALGFCVIGFTGLAAGFVQMMNVLHKDIVTNVSAFVANAGIAMTWGPLQTLTIETYPTVIR